MSRWLSRVPLILQSENAECGLACIAMIAGFHGRRIDVPSLRARTGSLVGGATLRDLMRIGQSLGLASRVFRLDVEDLRKLRMPCILHWDMSHFVVLTAVRRHYIEIHDPAVGICRVTLRDASKHFTGVAIELAPGERFTPVDERAGLGLRDLLGALRAHRGFFALLIWLAMLGQLIALLTPFYIQIVVDRVIIRNDLGLLHQISLVFVGVVIADVSLRAVRLLATRYLSTVLSSSLAEGLLTHIVKLPMTFFGTRSLASVLSHFDALAFAREVTAEDLPKVVVDGFMIVAALFVMATYDPALVGVFAAFVLGHYAYRFYTFRRVRTEILEKLVRANREREHFMDTVRGIQTVKVTASEQVRLSHWRSLLIQSLTAQNRVSSGKLAQDAIRDAIFAIENVLSMLIAAHLLMFGEMSMGMLFGFVVYKRLFLGSWLSLNDVFFKLKEVQVSLERLSDVTQARPEACYSRQRPALAAEPDTLSVRGLTYSYGGNGPPIIRGVSFDLARGERLVIVGPTGCGKSTLIRILLGLLDDFTGEVRVAGQSIGDVDRASILRRVGVVMQADRLFAGNIRENIAFGWPQIDDDKVAEAARLACIHEDVERLPMKYETPVGEIGDTLSAGQVQRLLIARALYGKPALLILDEGTAHLDEHTESRVLASFRDLGITVIHAAHRRQVRLDATQVLDLAATHGDTSATALKPTGVLALGASLHAGRTSRH